MADEQNGNGASPPVGLVGQRVVTVPADLIQDLVTYLGEQKWRDVDRFLHALVGLKVTVIPVVPHVPPTPEHGPDEPEVG